MTLENIIESLNKYIIEEREERKIDCKTFLILQKSLVPQPMFKAYKEYTVTFKDENGNVKAGTSSTRIFMYPGYKFKVVDQMFTNFHTPESTLIMLVSAFAGRENILNAYQKAVENKYRFFSYGDAMFIR